MNEEYLYEVGQEVWVAFPETRTVRVGRLLECVIHISDAGRTVTYTLRNGTKTFSATEAQISLGSPEALAALLTEMGVD